MSAAQLSFALEAPRPVTRGWRTWMEAVAIDWWNSSCAGCSRWAWDSCTCGLHPDGRCGMRGACYGDCGLSVPQPDEWGVAA